MNKTYIEVYKIRGLHDYEADIDGQGDVIKIEIDIDSSVEEQNGLFVL